MSYKNEKVNAKKLTYEIILSKGYGSLTRKAQNMIILLANNAIRKLSYKDEDDKMDCLQTSMLNMMTKWTHFNPDKTNNAFAYFTEIHKRSIAEFMNYWYNKKGLKKEEQSYITNISINSANNGQGMHNM